MSVYFKHLSRPTVGSLSHLVVQRRCYAQNKGPTNHYDTLHVNSSASAKEIKSAFYKLSKKHHPDVNPDDVKAAEKFSTISNAYDILSDSVKRRDYDNELSSNTAADDPYVTYDRTSRYAQRARAHRPSSWKPPPSSSYSRSASGGFQGSEGAFGSSRSTNYSTFEREPYDAAFGRFRGPTPSGRSTVYDYDEFYRAHYADLKNFATSKKDAEERARSDRQQEKANREQKAQRSTAAKLSSMALWLSVGIVVIFISHHLHDMHFQNPSDELRAKFYVVPKKAPTSPSESSKS